MCRACDCVPLLDGTATTWDAPERGMQLTVEHEGLEALQAREQRSLIRAEIKIVWDIRWGAQDPTQSSAVLNDATSKLHDMLQRCRIARCCAASR
mmetsp:Transcript_31225/g.54587  ORF Transcript_31225/g.54587 Transcript_31225/m.54587 type:complete len:95 (+) Transcript_31225:209-493(+)